MTTSECVVAVDVGNTAVKLALRAPGNQACHSVQIDGSRWEQSVLQWVTERSAGASVYWRVASVHLAASQRLADAVADRSDDSDPQPEQFLVVSHRDVPLAVKVDQPDRLGIDRLLSAFAVANRWGSPAAIVDAGSAITVDLVDQSRTFCGGAILPGIAMQAAALANGAEALPQIELRNPDAVALPARNTHDAMRAGILVGASAAVDALIDSYREIVGSHQDWRVFVTGGDAEAIAQRLQCTSRVVANLVCHGLLDLPPRHQKSIVS